MKRILCVLLAALFCLTAFSACRGEQKPELKDSRLTHETKFGGVYFDKTIDEFNALGFLYGDSLDIVFSNGKTMDDIPYYNGYYSDIDAPLMVAYPGYPFVRAGINYGEDLWVKLELDESVTATVTLRERGKYLGVQNARDIVYSDEQGEKSDAVFGNFRAVNMGKLKKDILYRGASPCDDQHKRAAVVDVLCKQAGVAFMINLSDSAEDFEGYLSSPDFRSPHFKDLLERGCVAALDLGANFKSKEFEEGLARGLTAASEHEGPYLVHCVEGKDRTGYVMMLLEAFCGATYTEIIDDYMLTYDNYYSINRESDPDRYTVIKEKNVDMMLAYMAGKPVNENTPASELEAAARALMLRIGMTETAVNALYGRLTGN